MKAFGVMICALALAAPAFSYEVLDRCSLAREMSRLVAPRNQLAGWACMAKQ